MRYLWNWESDLQALVEVAYRYPDDKLLISIDNVICLWREKEAATREREHLSIRAIGDLAGFLVETQIESSRDSRN